MNGAGPKALALAGGVTLLERSLALLSRLCDEVVVCAPAEIALPVPAALRVDDPRGAQGPLVALLEGLRSRPFERALALGVDLPCLRESALRDLGERLGAHSAVVPFPHGRAQPLAAWYSPAAVAPLAAAVERGDRALVAPVLQLPHLAVPSEDLAALEGGVEAFLNVNTPEDLALAERLLSGATA